MPNLNNKLPADSQPTLKVSCLTAEGRGLAHYCEKPAFITAALPNETVKVNIIRKNRRQLEGFASEIINPHPARISPKCEHFERCGGCSLQHMPADEQIKHKQSTFVHQLQHIGRVQPQTLLAPLTDSAWAYRTRARVSVKFVHNKNKICIGFRERGGRYITDMHHCPVLHPTLAAMVPMLAPLVASLSAYQHIPQFELAAGDTDAAVIMRHLKPLTPADEDACRQFAQQHALHFYGQAKGPESVKRLWPRDAQIAERCHYRLPQYDLTLAFHPNDFTQINAGINQRMIEQALTWLQLDPHARVLDLFCGLGNFSLPAARNAATLTGIEGCSAMVNRADDNARANHITNCNFYQTDLFSPSWTDQPWAKAVYDALIIDPPRSGAASVVRHIDRLNPSRIAYISCHPATLARDAEVLVHHHGYRCLAAGIMDMFPQTQHVEAMAIFERKH